MSRLAVRKQRTKRKTIAEANAWISERYPQILRGARKNCLRLTSKPTFGSATVANRRSSGES
jgi:hypothetical protein